MAATTVRELHEFILHKGPDPYKIINVKIEVLPESIGGGLGVWTTEIKKLEIEDDGTLTIVIEDGRA